MEMNDVCTVNRVEMNHRGELNHDFQIKISQQRMMGFAHFFDKFSFEKQRFQTNTTHTVILYSSIANE